MPRPLVRFATQVDPKLLEEVRAIAVKEGRQLHSVIDEALRELVEKREQGLSRSETFISFGESLAEFDALYKELAVKAC